MAAEIFSDMVMADAIKDKTIQVQQKLKSEEDSSKGPSIAHLYHKQEAELDQDDIHDDFGGLDEEEEKIMRQYRDERLTQLKSSYQQRQEDMIKGHGSYTEITETEFLPKVTSSKYVICHIYH